MKLTGAAFDDLLTRHVALERPVWLVTNATFAKLDPASFVTWHTASGDLPITWHELPRDAFREAWEQMGKQALSYAPSP